MEMPARLDFHWFIADKVQLDIFGKQILSEAIKKKHSYSWFENIKIIN